MKETKNEAAVFDCADEACSLVNAKSLLKFLLLRSLSSIDQERLNNTRSERGPMEAGEDTPRVRQCVFFVLLFVATVDDYRFRDQESDFEIKMNKLFFFFVLLLLRRRARACSFLNTYDEDGYTDSDYRSTRSS